MEMLDERKAQTSGLKKGNELPVGSSDPTGECTAEITASKAGTSPAKVKKVRAMPPDVVLKIPRNL